MYSKTKRITVSALLVALGVLFSRLLSVHVSLGGTYSVNFGLGMLPILLLSVIYGPVYGCLGALMWDLVGALLFPQGGFVVWFTMAAAMLGLITGRFFSKSESEEFYDEKYGYTTAKTIYHAAKPATLKRIFAAVVCGQFVYSVVLNTALIHLLYSVPVSVLLVPRLIENCIMVFVNTLLIKLLLPVLQRTNIIPERLPKKQKVSLSDLIIEPVESPASNQTNEMHQMLSNEIALLGGYICNKNFSKAKELYESVMSKYRNSPEDFTPAQKKDLGEYRNALMTNFPDEQFIIIEDTFDTDAELLALERTLDENNMECAETQLNKLMKYFSENMSMFSTEQKTKLGNLRTLYKININK